MRKPFVYVFDAGDRALYTGPVRVEAGIRTVLKREGVDGLESREQALLEKGFDAMAAGVRPWYEVQFDDGSTVWAFEDWLVPM